MILLSWTMTHAAAPPVHAALESARPIVDAHLVIWTSAEPSPLGHIPDAVGESGPGRRTVYKRNWLWTGSYGEARNAALDLVDELTRDQGLHTCPGGCDACDRDDERDDVFSMMIDDDERAICPDPAAFRVWLEALPAHVQVVLVHHEDGSHTRERFFRTPAHYKFQGRTHESLPCPENEQTIAPPHLIRWSEKPKTLAQLRAKCERDAELLREDIRANPRNGAAHHYLGDSLRNLALFARDDGDAARSRELFTEALAAFQEHLHIDTSGAPAWLEGTAFSCYRAAECCIAIGDPSRAVLCAAAGLALDAGIGELYWIAAVASLQEGRLEQARAWAMSAKVHALGSDSERRRKGFRIPRGLTTGPDEILNAITVALLEAGCRT